MGYKVVCNEAEITLASNKIENYVDFLARSIQLFNQQLATIQDGPIKDNAICSKLYLLSEQIKPCIETFEAIRDNCKAIVKNDLEQIEVADDYKYPDMDIAKISSMLANFHF